ncbi:uncharacterized exonuclease C637.09 isoform X2 [Nematostella vectensis]|uniref:uncharacterized exonuclease C637.09 isoform X2 n=1 Tax=Nematostella vectensis TaxID=45351 RepID=UPI0020770DD3|nr:uncharacterized exonuclease C637.09 isoform X2 [Nematostella vectensis]
MTKPRKMGQEEEVSEAIQEEPDAPSLKRKISDNGGADIDSTVEPQKRAKSKKKKKRKEKKDQKEKMSQKTSEEQITAHTEPFQLRLKEFFGKGGERAEASQLKIRDLQELILHVHMKEHNKAPPWCMVSPSLKKTVFVLLSAVGQDDFQTHNDCFPFMSKNFPMFTPTKTSGANIGFELPHNTLLYVPLSKNATKKLNFERQQAFEEESKKSHGRDWCTLTKEQLKENDYPSMCYEKKLAEKDTGGYVWLSTNGKQDRNTQPSKELTPMFAIDCEMCTTSEGLELTRVSVVEEDCTLLYDTFVKPDRPIIDYNTKYSGITAEMLDGVTVKLADVQKELQAIIPPGAIVAGHSLECDLKALKMAYDHVIDTAVVYGDGRGALYKPALRYLAQTYLNLLHKLSNSGVSCSFVDYPGIAKAHSAGGHHTIICSSDEQVESHALKQINKSDFTWVHFHAAEDFHKDTNKSRKFESVLHELDARVASIAESLPSDCLLMVLLGHGDRTEIMSNREQKSKNTLRRLTQEASKGLCFFRTT